MSIFKTVFFTIEIQGYFTV